MAVSDGADPLHITGLSIEVNGQNRFCSRGNCRLDSVRIYAEECVRFDEHRCRAILRDSQNTGDIGVGRCDHLIPGADPQRADGQNQSVEPGIHADAVLHTQICGKLPLKGLQLFAEDIPPGTGRAQERLLVFCSIEIELFFQVDKLNHAACPLSQSGET